MTAADFLRLPFLALDTEFVWTRTYHARLGLVQAAPSGGFDPARLPLAALPYEPAREDERGALLFDPLRSDPQPLKAVLEDPSCAKLLHDATQDLQHLARWCGGAAPRTVFDTRLAAGFCGLPSTLSLARLVEETCGVVLPKTETRTDWCRRPLSPEQLRYAAQDVVYLDRAARELLRRAESFGTTAWLFEEMARFDDPALYVEPAAGDAWRRLKPPPALRRDAAALRRLRALAAWRERTARERDLPRKWIVEDAALYDAALRPPATADDVSLRAVPRAFRAGLVEALRVCAAEPASPVSDPEPRRDAEARQRASHRASALLPRVARLAEPLHVDPALVCSRAELAAFLLEPDDPAAPLNRGWRAETFGAAVRAWL